MVLRSIVKIDEEKCTGCGLCVSACAEEAIQIVDGKARLISDRYCDGLGACLVECPQDAITIEKRDAEKFDEKAVEKHLKEKQSTPPVHSDHAVLQSCPSMQVMHFESNLREKETVNVPEKRKPMLSQWPVQLKLMPVDAPFFEDADLLIAADCVPFAYANFHNDFLQGKILIIGCPKLDNTELYREKLIRIFKGSNVRSLTVVNMEVPCCFGLYGLVKDALASSGKTIPLNQQTISIKGDKICAQTCVGP